METDPRTLLTSGCGHCVKSLVRECDFPSLWSFLLAPETGSGQEQGCLSWVGAGGHRFPVSLAPPQAYLYERRVRSC